jgi:hypothetical protein
MWKNSGSVFCVVERHFSANIFVCHPAGMEFEKTAKAFAGSALGKTPKAFAGSAVEETPNAFAGSAVEETPNAFAGSALEKNTEGVRWFSSGKKRRRRSLVQLWEKTPKAFANFSPGFERSENPGY